MGDLRYGPICVPGGWQIGVPEIRVDNEMLGLVSAAGIPQDAFNQSMQMVFERGMMKHVRDYMRYWARVYKKMYPELWDQESGTLSGFDPEDLMRFWLPSEKVWGKDNVEIRYQLSEYAREAREE